MAIKHDNPTKPRLNKDNQDLRARAPYNFVPLPEQVALARPPLPHDVYDLKEGKTGWIDCELETLSPTYIRGMLNEEQFAEFGRSQEEGRKKDADSQEVDARQAAARKEQHAPFFSTGEQKIDGYPVPRIPGSSLRGMTRALVEIIGYGRMRWVAGNQPFTFRAVAAPEQDPLRDPYRDVIGAFSANVRAGYLVSKEGEWFIHPALTPAEAGWKERAGYLKVKEHVIGSNISGYRRLDSHDYRPGWFRVDFEAENRRGTRGEYTAVTDVADRGQGYRHQGTLVCSGNMMEAQGDRRERERKQTRRKNHALVLPKNPRAQLLPIRREAVDDYRAGLTPFQEAFAWGGSDGVLKADGPVFYVPGRGEVAYFGHSPNFRIPARLAKEGRAATALDFVPETLRDNKLGPDASPDLAEAIFGWVYDGDELDNRRWDDDSRKRDKQRAGRVFFSDAQMIEAPDGVWLRDKPFAPRTLSGPKPTTFQHYLTQNRRAGHDPDNRKMLAHYGTRPGETEIRGHKLYWPRGANPPLDASDDELKHESQLTRLMPLKPRVRFAFRVYFENLRPEELGALWWALALPGPAADGYCHRLGMGKPLGMGVVRLQPRLFITNRRARYETLFDGDHWAEAAEGIEQEEIKRDYVDAFEDYLLRDQGVGRGNERLADEERIRMLLAMLEWREGTDDWLDSTRYMEIERQLRGDVFLNEYKERPVLPDPLAVTRATLPRVGVNRAARGTSKLELPGRKGEPPSPPRRESEPKAAEPQKDQPPVKEPSTVTTKPAESASVLAGSAAADGRGQIIQYLNHSGMGQIRPDDGGPVTHFRREWLLGNFTPFVGQRVIYRKDKGRIGDLGRDVRPE